MIINYARFEIQLGKKKEAIDAMKILAEKTKSDAGYIAYDVCEDFQDENALTFIEKWESAAVLDKHMQTAHIKEFDAKAPEFIAGPPTVKTFTVVE